jgi:Chaperone of endosialidase
MKTSIRSLAIITFAIMGFALLPNLRAVVPAPDGGYPGGNTAEGQSALLSLTSGTHNTAVGYVSLFRNTTGFENTAIGATALQNNTIGRDNTANGYEALLSNTTGFENTTIGALTLVHNTTGRDNTANGYEALANNTTGRNNTAIGRGALLFSGGNNNTVLGANAGIGVTTASNVICIGANVAGNNVNDSCYIGNIFGDTSSGGIAVLVNTNGRLGTMTSSRRFKDDIKPMGKISEALLALKPVSFRYKKEIDPTGISQFGLVAEEVANVNPDLVVRDKRGKPYSVRYDQVNAMLLNEFLKARRQIDAQQKQIDALATGLQKVSAQLELSKSAPQTVLNNQQLRPCR